MAVIGAWFVLWLGACPKPEPTPTPPPTPPAVSPRLVVYVVVDQLPVRLFEAARPAFVGGFARLAGPDAYGATARHAHAITFTCPGHAVLSTGAPPAESGIPANDWFVAGKPMYCADANLLRAEPVADRVAGLVASLSIKDRGAVILGGHHPDLVASIDLTTFQFIGTGVDPLNAAVDVERDWAQPWTALRPDHYATLAQDARLDERGPGGVGTTFPHPALSSPGIDPKKAFRANPIAGTVLTDAAIFAVDHLHLGADDTPDLLTISYSQTDYVGHAFTAESWEAVDTLLRLDQDLERLFVHLDAAVGAGRWSVVLTSDHGSAPGGVPRADPSGVSVAADAALVAAGLPAGVVFEDPSIYLPEPLHSDPVQRAAAAEVVAAAVTKLPYVAKAYAWREPGGLPADDPLAESVRLSVDPERSGDLYVLIANPAIFDYPGIEGGGTSHGTPYDYDALVPLLAWGVGVRPGADAAIPDTRQIAPTVGALLGVGSPADARLGHVDALLAR